MELYGAVEAGGTKILAAVGSAGEEPLALERIPTTDPGETLDRIIRFFRARASEGLPIRALGVGCFGPVDLDPDSSRWGFVTSTPKPRWQGADVAGTLGRALGVPVGFDTDVNAAALAEYRLGAAEGQDPTVYLTVGTGIGGGAVVNGKLLHGAAHPEMGHMLMSRRGDDAFPGSCPFHGSCWEGLASGPAVEARWGRPGEDLPPGHPAWDLEAWYLAQGIVNLLMVLSPRAVILGGGISQVPGLINQVRSAAASLCAGYLDRPRTPAEWARTIREPGLKIPGLTGAFLLAEDAADTKAQ